MNTTRPSSVGEILDRAISTYISRCVPLFVILAVISVPVALLESGASPGITHVADAIVAVSKIPPGDVAAQAAAMRKLQGGAMLGPSLLGIYLVQGLLMALANTALIVFACAALDGARMSIAQAYRRALGRWVPQIVTGIAFIAILIGVGIGCVIAGVLIGLAIAVIALVSKAVAIVVGVVVGIALLVAIFVATALGNVAWIMAMVSVATEEPNPFRAIGNGLRRTLDRSLIGRTTGAALAVLALTWFGSIAILAFGGALAFVTRFDLLANVIASAGGVVIAGLCIVFVMTYVRDVQIRREGSDLLLLAAEPSLPV